MTLTLELNGTEFSKFTSADASIALDQFVNTFAFGAISDEPQGFPVKVGDRVKILADGTAIVTGFVLGLDGSHSDTSRQIRITGASRTVDIVDSSINQLVFNIPISLQSVIENVLSEIGSSIVVTNEVSGLADFEESELIAAEPGQKAFGLIEQYARKRQVFVRTGPDGSIFISRNPGKKTKLKLLSRFEDNTNNVKLATLSINHNNRYNKYKAISQQSQQGLSSLNKVFGADEVSDQSGTATDNDIRSTRALTFVSENATDSDGLKNRAIWEADVRRANSLTYTAEVAGHSADSSPWRVNNLIRVIDEWEDVDAVLLIDRLTFSFSVRKGSTTKIRCVSPDAYTLEASEPQKQKETNSIGGLFGGQ